MKAFFERYSYDSMRMFLSQFAISIFGFALAMTAISIKSDTLLWISSVGAIIFYLVLIYGAAWKAGSNDRNPIRYGHLTYRPLTGFFVSLLANSLNLLLALLNMFAALAHVNKLGGIVRPIALFIQGMYQGLLATFKIGDAYLNNFWWVYFLILVPALLVSTVGYIAGAKDFMITRLGVPDLPASDRPTKQEKREMREKQKQDRRHDDSK